MKLGQIYTRDEVVEMVGAGWRPHSPFGSH